MTKWLSIAESKFYDWKKRYGKANEHNAWIPRDHWIEDHEKQAIIAFAKEHPSVGYRRLAFMLIDHDVAAVSPTSVYRILKSENLLNRWNNSPTRKGKGFVQPLEPHKHWHIDVSYINICGTFYYLCSVLDGCSRFIVHWDIRESMKEDEIQIILQRALEKQPGVKPRLISDNGPQFIANDFKKFIKQVGMSHVRTSPYYPQSNGKLERWHKTIKGDLIRKKTPLSLEEARELIADYVVHYNEIRLHSAIGYVTPKDRLEGRHEEIWRERDRKLEEARERRRISRQAQRERKNYTKRIPETSSSR